MGYRGVLTGQLAHAAVDLGFEARLTVSAGRKHLEGGGASIKFRQFYH